MAHGRTLDGSEQIEKAAGLLAGLRLALHAEVLEVRIGLVLGHGPPRPLGEETAGEVGDAGPPELGADLLELLEAFPVMDLDLVDPRHQPGEGMAVGGEHQGHVGQPGQAVEESM